MSISSRERARAALGGCTRQAGCGFADKAPAIARFDAPAPRRREALRRTRVRRAVVLPACHAWRRAASERHDGLARASSSPRRNRKRSRRSSRTRGRRTGRGFHKAARSGCAARRRLERASRNSTSARLAGVVHPSFRRRATATWVTERSKPLAVRSATPSERDPGGRAAAKPMPTRRAETRPPRTRARARRAHADSRRWTAISSAKSRARAAMPRTRRGPLTSSLPMKPALRDEKAAKR